MADDLSRCHEMVGTTFPLGGSDRSVRLTSDELRSFSANGFVRGGRILDSRQLQTLRAELETFFDANLL